MGAAVLRWRIGQGKAGRIPPKFNERTANQSSVLSFLTPAYADCHAATKFFQANPLRTTGCDVSALVPAIEFVSSPHWDWAITLGLLMKLIAKLAILAGAVTVATSVQAADLPSRTIGAHCADAGAGRLQLDRFLYRRAWRLQLVRDEHQFHRRSVLDWHLVRQWRSVDAPRGLHRRRTCRLQYQFASNWVAGVEGAWRYQDHSKTIASPFFPTLDSWTTKVRLDRIGHRTHRLRAQQAAHLCARRPRLGQRPQQGGVPPAWSR